MRRLLFLAYRNLKRRQSQSMMTIAITAMVILIFTIVFSASYTVGEGMRLSRERLGADCVIVPKYSPVKGEDLLFTAEPENIYMDKEVFERVKALGGYKEITPQFYCQTLSLDCCVPGETIRIIGFDPETDFILPPYLKYDTPYLNKEDIVLGSSLEEDLIGENYLILGEQFIPKNQLMPTGTGMDDTIFMHIDTVRRLSIENPILSENWKKKDPFEKISVIMIKLDGRTSPEVYEEMINSINIDGRLIHTSDTIATMQNQTTHITKILFSLWIALLIVSILSLYSRYSNLAMARRKEIGLLSAIGVSKGEIFFSMFVECIVLSCIGGLIGAVVGVLITPNVVHYLKEAFNLSESMWDNIMAIKASLLGILMGLLIGAISSVYPVFKTASMNPHDAISRGEI